MNKKRKFLKLSEKVLQEIINGDMDIINGGKVEFPGGAYVKTSTDTNKKDGMAYTTDKHADSAVQPRTLQFRGYSSGTQGTVYETYNIIDDTEEISEDVYKRNDNTDVLPREVNDDIQSEIPGIETLNSVYDATELEEKIDGLVNSLTGFSKSQNFNDLLAISMKELLSKVNFSVLSRAQKTELVKMLTNG